MTDTQTSSSSAETDDMKDRIDPLIAERAPWLFSEKWYATPAREGLTRLLGYGRTVALEGLP